MCKNNINIPFEQYKKTIGLKFNEILNNIGIEKSLHKKINQDYFKLTKKYQGDIQLYPYVKETINKVKRKEYYHTALSQVNQGKTHYIY